MTKTAEQEAEEWVRAESANLDMTCDPIQLDDLCIDWRHILWGAVKGYLAGHASAEKKCNSRIGEVLELVEQQAWDGGLWFPATTATEAYLQEELRRLHAAIEKSSPKSKKSGE